MKLALMQPYFFPYLGYFSLIEATDRFVFFDTPQFIKGGWMNRNRILHPESGFSYITVPVNRVQLSTPTNEKTIYQNKWKKRIFGQLEGAYKKYAPHYKHTVDFIRSCLETDYMYLAQLNIETTIKVCEYIGLPIDYSVFSQMGLEINPVYAPDEWALNTALAMGYDVYRNVTGGQTFYDSNKYISHKIRLEFIKNRLSNYDQNSKDFVPGLSIIDVLMFNSPEETLALIKDYDVITGANDDDVHHKS